MSDNDSGEDRMYRAMAVVVLVSGLIVAGVIAGIIAVIISLSGCSLSYCDLYPAGNSHAGPKCLECHKHWNGEWRDNATEKTCTTPEDWPK